MKRIFKTSLIVTCVIFSVSIFGHQLPTNKTLTNKDAVIKSLLTGINSDNYGLRASSAYLIGELNISEAVIPLMKMLRNEKQDEARIMAALSLYKLGDSRGIFAIKQAIRFDESERVRKMCEKIYGTYITDRYSNSDETILAGF